MTSSLSFRRLMTLGGTLLLTVQFLTSFGFAAAAGKRNPTSKFYVADVEGISQVNTGEKIEELTKKSVHSAQGTIVETNPNSTNAIVYSNGTGVFIDHDTRLEVRRFVQEPFTPNRTDIEVEPSISRTQSFLSRGSIGLCTSKLVAGSSMIYRTSLATIAIRGRKVVIESNDKTTKVSLVQGDATVRGGEYDSGGVTLVSGQQAIVSAGREGSPNSIAVQEIPAADMKNMDDKVTVACMAKNTVYFEVAERKNDNNSGGVTAFDGSPTGQELVAVPVVPASLPAQFTVSPANLSNR
jgi:hypothetical protein